MQEAYGGVLNIVLIAIFLVIVEGVLGLAVNYTKAFKMKNIVISNIERYDGAGCFGKGECTEKIKEGAKSIGYHPVDINCPIDPTTGKKGVVEGVFCYSQNKTIDTKVKSDNEKMSYRIVTQVDINIPIINKIMGLSFFQVKGDTRVIQP